MLLTVSTAWAYIPSEPEPTWAPTPTIVLVNGKVYAECPGYNVVLMMDGIEVDNPYTLPEPTYYEEQVIEFSAYTIANDETYNSDLVYFIVTIAAIVPEVTATPVIYVEYNFEEEYAMISASGYGTVKLYIDGMEVQNPFVYLFQDDEQEIVVTATAQEEGKEISETAEETYVIPAKTTEPVDLCNSR